MTEPSRAQVRRLLASARAAARRAGDYVARRSREGGAAMRRKGVGDFVTEVDLRVERMLRSELLAASPESGFLGEEGGLERGEAELVWVVDPVDGTSNFARGLTPWAVSVACLHEGSPLVAAMVCHPEGALYSAARGMGAYRDRRRLAIPPGRYDDGAIYGCQWHRGRQRLPFLARLQEDGARIRNQGCTVAQLCAVARGSLDANLQEQGRIWDFAGAALVVLEAGGHFTDWRGGPVFPVADLPGPHRPSLAAPPRVHARILGLLGGARGSPHTVSKK